MAVLFRCRRSASSPSSWPNEIGFGVVMRSTRWIRHAMMMVVGEGRWWRILVSGVSVLVVGGWWLMIVDS